MVIVNVDFTARTFDAIRTRGLTFLKGRIGNFAYNDAISTGVAPAIIDVLAWFHEQNAYYYDRRRRNSLLILADTLESMRILTRAQGYRMRPATAAGVSVLAQPDPPQPASILLKAGTTVQAAGLTFELIEDHTIPPSVTTWPDGTTDDVIVLTEGVTRVDRFTSDGSQWQSFPLSQPGVIDGSVAVVVLGEEWEEVAALAFVEGTQQGRDAFTGTGVDSQEYVLSLMNPITSLEDEDGITVLIFPLGQPQSALQVWQQVAEFTGAPREFTTIIDISGNTRVRFGLAADGTAPGAGSSIQVLYLIAGSQKRYQLAFDEDDAGLILFGDGVFGVIPSNNSDIVVSYRVGGGQRGNVPPGTISVSVQGVLPSGASTPVRLRNLERGDGGQNPESVESARVLAPRFAKSNNRAVREEDWNALASSYVDQVFGAPSYASCFLKQKRPERNTVVCALWGRDSLGRVATPGSALKIGVKRFLDARRTFTTTVEMKDGEIVQMDLDLSIELVRGQSRQAVFAAVTASVSKFFNSALVRPGTDVPIGELFRVIESTAGVERVLIESIIGSRLVQIVIGTGDGVTATFSGDFVLEDGTSVVLESTAVTDGTLQVVDDGDGSFLGSVDVGGTNTMDYSTGKFTTTFANPPVLNASIRAEAKIEVFFANTENIGSSNGAVTSIDGATVFYPIIKRPPRGIWSGDQQRIVDGAQVGASDQYRGALSDDVNTSSLTFIDDAAQTVFDNGAGVLLQGATPVGTIDYASGVYNFTYLGASTLPVKAAWTTRTVDVTLATEFLPLTPGRVFFWGGFAKDGAQVGGEIIAFDDGNGNIVGDVLAGGTVLYETGEVNFRWNADPSPGIAGGASRFGYLRQTPDGVLTQFDFDVFVLTGGPLAGGQAAVDLSGGGDDGEGRTRFVLSDLSSVGFALDDVYDNWQGALDGPSLDRENTNALIYLPSGLNSTSNGTVTFSQPLPVGTPLEFPVQVTNVGVYMVSAWVFYVKTPTGPGLDKSLFADNNGRLWGDVVNPFPVDRLDHLRGRYYASLAGSPIVAGRSLALTYDAQTSVPPVRDIPIDADQVAVVGRIKLTELPPESNARA